MKWTRKNPIGLRASIIGAFFSIWLLAIGGRVFYLQVIRGDFLSGKASGQVEGSVKTEGKRGIIYDCNRREMAVSLDVTSIAAYPGEVDDVNRTSAILADTLRIDRRALVRRLSLRRSFVWVERQVTPKESTAISALQLGGIDFRNEHKRFYPSRTLAAQVIGFTGIDGLGLEGVEYRYNDNLEGNDKRLTVLKDALGNRFSSEGRSTAGTNGHDLVLTIDARVQFFTEQAIKAVVDEFAAKSAIAIVMVPETGAVLALAHYPFFNPNAFNEFEQWQWRNRAITDPFEPGSTLKIFTAAAAIEKGGVTPNTIFFCENGEYRVAGHPINDTHKHEWLSLQQIVKFSSNIGAVKVLEKIGPEVLDDTLRAFGFGERTGIDCPGETAGCLAPYQKWRGVEASTISFGQGVSVSAIQLAAAVNAIANDGVLMRPFVVQAVVNDSGKEIERFDPQAVRRVVSSETARAVKRIMATVTSEGGTGEKIGLEDYPVAGKTGTAQKTDETGGYAEDKYIASFVGFVPADNPRATIVVIVDEPEYDHYGGTVAGPAFKKIAEELLYYMNVPPALPSNQLIVSRGSGVKG